MKKTSLSAVFVFLISIRGTARADTITLNFADIPIPPPVSVCTYAYPDLFQTLYGVNVSGGLVLDLSQISPVTSDPCYSNLLGSGIVYSTLSFSEGAIVLAFDPTRLPNVTGVSFFGVTTLESNGYGLYTSPPTQVSANGSTAHYSVSGTSVTANAGDSLSSVAISATSVMGYEAPVISINSIVIQEGPAMDLAVSPPQPSQAGAVINPNDGLLQVSPGNPIQVNVPVSGSSLGASQMFLTTVILQAGSQAPQSQTISLADIQSGAVSSVTFNVTFDPSLSGTTQTITAMIDPGNALNESNFSNNTASVQVDVVANNKLVAFFNGSTTPIPDAGGSQVIAPTIKACGTGSYANPPIPAQVPLEIRCVAASDPSYTPVTGCKFFIDLSPGPDNGGHNHNLSDETRPYVLDIAPANFPVGSFQPVDTAGASLVYAPPEVSGDVFLEVTGTDPNGNQINGPSYMFHVQSGLALINLNGAGMASGNPGISIVTSSHPLEGTFGTSTMQAKVSKMVAKYYQYGDEAGFTSLDPLASQAATMVEGGLFDANWNGGIYPTFLTPWEPPHCGHRDGQTIDLSINQLDQDEQDWLKNAAAAANFVFTAPGERPGDVGATHWHATLN